MRYLSTKELKEIYLEDLSEISFIERLNDLIESIELHGNRVDQETITEVEDWINNNIELKILEED